jgi:AcrR family transcriptional regulator
VTRSTQERILDATFDVVADVGLSGLTLEDVATKAGVSRQTLYRHFGSRGRLVEALLVREEQWFVDRVKAAAAPCTTAEDGIAAGATAAVTAAAEHPLLFRLLETDPGGILPLVVLGKGPVISMARPVVEELLAGWLGRPRGDVAEIADVCSRLLVSYVLDPGSDRPEAIGDRIAQVAMGGIASLPARAG